MFFQNNLGVWRVIAYFTVGLNKLYFRMMVSKNYLFFGGLKISAKQGLMGLVFRVNKIY